MALDLWIYGPGLGECVVMAWDEPDGKGGTVKTAAVIDSYGGETPEDNPALHRLAALGNPRLAFVAVTHPHLDHVENMRAVLETHQSRMERIFWWGGHDASQMLHLYRTMCGLEARHRRIPPEVAHEVLGDCALHTSEFIEKSLLLSGALEEGSQTVVGSDVKFRALLHVGTIYQDHPTKPRLEVSSIAPWQGPQKVFRTNFEKQVDKKGRVRPRRLLANQTSLAFVVRYGKAQVLLGGDMERESWEALRSSGCCPKLNPTMVKVSHHGSLTGVMEGMWPPGNGFFQSARRPLCVVTPWNKGTEARRLPRQDVLETIQAAGCRVVLTGSQNARHWERPQLKPTHVRIHPDGRHKLVTWDKKHGRVLEPK